MCADYFGGNLSFVVLTKHHTCFMTNKWLFFFIFLNQQLLGNLSKVLCRDFVIFPFVTCIARLAGVILASRMGSPGPFAISESTCAGSPSGSIPLLKAKPQKSA